MNKIINSFLLSIIFIGSLALLPRIGLSYEAVSLSTLSNNPYQALTCADSQDVSQAECEALVDLYNSTDGTNWYSNTNWTVINASTDVCDWSRISCSADSITGIDLYHNNLVGFIPSTIGNLTNLESLDMYNNQLSGSIPSDLGNLGNLAYLVLDTNQLSDPIPPELGNLGNLEYLNLGTNKLTGAIPPELGNLVNLKSLLLYRNHFNGAIPPELGNLVNLESLNLDINWLNDEIPSELGNLVNLKRLSLATNHLTGAIPSELGNLVNLEQLHLFENQLSGSIPPELGNLINLDILSLYNNQLTGGIPSELGNLVNLEQLHLYDNQLTGSMPISMLNNVNLYRIFYANTDICIPVDYPDPFPYSLYNPVIHSGTGLVCNVSPGALSGTVTNTSTNNNLEDIHVTLYKGDFLLDATITDSNGQYMFGNLGKGDYTIRFSDQSGTYNTEYYDNAFTIDTADRVSVTLENTTTNVDAILGDLTPLQPIANLSSNSGSATVDPATGLTAINIPKENITAITASYSAICADGSIPSQVTLIATDNLFLTTFSLYYPMNINNGNEYTVTIPANEVPDNHTLSVELLCSPIYEVNQNYETIEIGSINLYDPSGTITDINTGALIENAAVTLFYVPDWYPKMSPTDNRPNTCESNLSKSENTEWSQPAPVAQGIIVDPNHGVFSPFSEIAPALSTQVTNSDGYFGWDVPSGCWYVKVSASGYQTLTSPVVGFPPRVTDLNLKLSPQTHTLAVTDTAFTIPHDSVDNSTVGIVSATDANVESTLAYVITAGNTGSAFNISNSGVISVAPNSELVIGSTFTLTVQVTEQDNSSNKGSVSDTSVSDTAQAIVTITEPTKYYIYIPLSIK